MRFALLQHHTTPSPCQLRSNRSLNAVARSRVTKDSRRSKLPAVAQSSSDFTAVSTSTLESSVDEAQQTSCREALLGLGIAPTPAEQLFDRTHIQQWTPLLLAYAPLGCVLATVRMAAWILGIALDASWFRNKAVVDAYMALLGVTVKWEGEHNVPGERHVLVSNHVSTADLLMLFQRPQRYAHLITTSLPPQVYSCQHLPAILQPADKRTYLALAEAQQPTQQEHSQQQQLSNGLGALHLPASSTNPIGSSHLHSQHLESVVHLQQQEQQHLASSPSLASSSTNGSSSSGQAGAPGQQEQPSVHLFPEGGMTNGKGMMRFSRGFMLFADKLPVVPAALRVQGAFPQVRTHTIDSHFLTNLFWCSFQPWTVFEVTALPAMRMAPGESKAAFVQRVQLAIAQELGVWITELNIQQKRQLAGGGKPTRQQQQLKKQQAK